MSNFLFFLFFRECVGIVREKGTTNILTYSWFFLQFWPTHQTTSNMLHYTGGFKVRCMVEQRLIRKSNSDTHYPNAIYKFLKERAVKNRRNVSSFSADVSVGEPGYPIITITRGKKVIVGKNEKHIWLQTMILANHR